MAQLTPDEARHEREVIECLFNTFAARFVPEDWPWYCDRCTRPAVGWKGGKPWCKAHMKKVKVKTTKSKGEQIDYGD